MAQEKAAPAKEKKVEKKGKRVRKGRKHESQKAHGFYEIKGSAATRKNRPCPRCGSGTWLAAHKDRLYCGHCSYTEFNKKTQ